ncbi:receptor-like cytoplasmic kinase 176 [Bidens hawaiensis]|uniref:receptor-like cytoplasmic kinase 176 n=1 Tax=Bidens hawaiensis TaxID=980011 RepID=UPI00404A8FE7
MGSGFSVGSNTDYSLLDHGPASVSTRPRCFSDHVLEKATRNFPDMMLVEARLNSIYVGWIDEQSGAATKPGTGTAIAVKKLYYPRNYGTYEEWETEIKYLGQLNHQNILNLIGYCYLETDRRIHVYEFMPKGSLHCLLFRRGDDSEPLSWNRRLNIAVGVAKGLAYLDTTKAHMWRHLLTSSMIPIDSFAKGEVYRFGVVLLELLTGWPAFDKNQPSGKQEVAEFAKTYLRSEGKMLDIMDPSIEGQYSSAVATRAGLLAMRCLKRDHKLRPDAAELVKQLEQMQEEKRAMEKCCFLSISLKGG